MLIFDSRYNKMGSLEVGMEGKLTPRKPRRAGARLVLKKHSAIIQMSNAITGVQRKAWNFLLYEARQALMRDPEKRVFETLIGEVHRWTGVGATDHVKVKAALRALTDVKVEFNILGKDGEHWGVFVLLPSVEILPDGTVRYELTERIRQTLAHPRMYAPIDLGILRGLRGKYAIALYELAKDYVHVGIPEMSIDDFRKLMGLDPGQYRRDRDLLRWVIDPAVREVNNVTDLEISYTIFKNPRTRKWERIRFGVRRKGEGITPEDIAMAYDKALRAGCMPPPGRFGRPRVLWFFLSGDDPAYVASLVRAALEQGIENPVGFVRSKLQLPPQECFEALLYHDTLRPEWEDAIYRAFAVRVRVPADWRGRVKLGVITPAMAATMIDRLIEAGHAREVRADGGRVLLEFLPEPVGGGMLATDYVKRLILPALKDEAELVS